jgi:hypothetical protein
MIRSTYLPIGGEGVLGAAGIHWMPNYNTGAHLHPFPLRYASGTSCVQCGVTVLQDRRERIWGLTFQLREGV